MASRTMLEISRELASMAQAGITYSVDPFDRERFHRMREIAGEVLQHAGKADFEWPSEIGYSTPKVDVRGAVFRNGEVLLIREASSGKWTLPGGWADVNLTPAENVEKEMLRGKRIRSESPLDHGRPGSRSRRIPFEPACDLQDLLPLRSLRRRTTREPRSHGRRLFSYRRPAGA